MAGMAADSKGSRWPGGSSCLDYASGTAWVDAFHLGAAVVVFLESAGTHRKEAEQKFLDVPANLPRLYARRDVAERLRVFGKVAGAGALAGGGWRGER